MNRGRSMVGATRRSRERSLATSLLAALLALLVAAVPSGGVAAEEGPTVITVGESNDPAQVAELLAYFGAEDEDAVVTVTVAETAEAMAGIYDLSGVDTAYSSTALTCGERGDGLSVSTRNIEVGTPSLYAMALLTAGIDDATLVVAAPDEEPALGMTALTGVFLTWDLADCGTAATDPGRQELALEELALTAAIGEALGEPDGVGRATRTVLAVQRAVVQDGITDADAIDEIVGKQAAAEEIDIPDAERAQLVDLMARLAEADLDWGTFANGWTAERDADGGGIRLRGTGGGDDDEATGPAIGGVIAATPATPAGTPSAATPAASPAASPEASPAASPAVAQGAPSGPAAVTGTVAEAGGGQVVVGDGAGGATTAYRVEGGVPVFRAGQAADLGEIVAGDRVRLTVDPVSGRVARLDADPAPARPATQADRSDRAGWLRWLVPAGVLATLGLAGLLFARRRRQSQRRRVLAVGGRATPDARRWLIDGGGTAAGGTVAGGRTAFATRGRGLLTRSRVPLAGVWRRRPTLRGSR